MPADAIQPPPRNAPFPKETATPRRVVGNSGSGAVNAINAWLRANRTLSQLARDTGINKGQLSKIRRGLRPATLTERRALGLVRRHERADGIRVRMTLDEATRVLAHLAEGDSALRERLARAVARHQDQEAEG